jgi:hypothetical protein
VPQQSHFNWSTILQAGAIVTSVIVTVVTLSRR